MQVAPVPPTLPQISDPSSIVAIYQSVVGNWMNAIQNAAKAIFGSLAALDITVLGVQLWLDRHTIDSAILALIKKILVIGVFFGLLINGTTWMPLIINGFVQIGKDASGVQSIAPSSVLQLGANIAGKLLFAAAVNNMTGNLPVALGIDLAAIFIILAFLAITVLFVVALVDTYIAISIGTLFLGFGGSRWTVPYVERYFAFCVATGVKLMMMYLLIGAGLVMGQTWFNQNLFSVLNPIGAFVSAWLMPCGAFLLFFVSWHCSRMVTAFMGGSPSLTTSDVIAFAGSLAGAAAALTALVASAGTATPAVAGAGAAVGAGSAGGGAAAAGASGHTISSGMRASAASGATAADADRTAALARNASMGGGSSGGGSDGNSAASAARAAQLAANFLRGMPPSGHGGSPPRMNISH